jgi:ABC-type uncharacterized transport system permease subunit
MKQNDLMGSMTQSRVITYLVVLMVSFLVTFLVSWMLGYTKDDLVTELIVTALSTPVLAEWIIWYTRRRK